MMIFKKYPDVANLAMVGTYDAMVFSGGGYFYDDVLEYRVWVKPPTGASEYYAFSTYKDAKKFSKSTPFAEDPIVLVYQAEHINEPVPNKFECIKKPRVTEWQVDWLKGSKREPDSITNFLKKHGDQ